MNPLQNGSNRQQWQQLPELLPPQGRELMPPPYKRKMAALLFAASFSFRSGASADNGSNRQQWQQLPQTAQPEWCGLDHFCPAVVPRSSAIMANSGIPMEGRHE